MMLLQHKKRILIGLGAALAIFLFVGIYVFTHSPSLPIEVFLPQKIEACKTAKKRKECHKGIAQELLRSYDLETIFSTVEKNEQQPNVFAVCHEILHFVGQLRYTKEKDLTKAMGEGNPVCFAGYFHGVLETYMSSQDIVIGDEKYLTWLKEQVPLVCATNAHPKVQNECLHGLGHALMYATQSDLPVSLELCDELPNTSQEGWCYSGVFMENSTSSTNPNHPNQYLKEDDIMYPCSILKEKYLTMCYTLQSFYFAERTNFDWKETAKLCDQVPKAYVSACYNAIGQSRVGSTHDVTKVSETCFSVTSNQTLAQSCVNGAVGATLQRYNDGVEKAVLICESVTNSHRHSCYQQLIGGIYSTSKAPHEECTKLADQTQVTSCLSR